MNTYLVYLRFEHMRGRLDDTTLNRELELVRQTIVDMARPHLDEFVQAWPED